MKTCLNIKSILANFNNLMVNFDRKCLRAIVIFLLLKRDSEGTPMYNLFQSTCSKT